MSDIYDKIKLLNSALHNKHISNKENYSFSQFVTERSREISVNFMGEDTEEDLRNHILRIIDLIASMKDHIKDWAKKHSVTCDPDKIINGNKYAAIIHDLWNIDKHGSLDRPPRSGFTPSLGKIRAVMRVTASGPNTHAALSVGEKGLILSSSGNHKRILIGSVMDEKGATVGDVMDICGRALDAWIIECTALKII